MKTKEELNAIKEEYTELNKKLAELTEEELSQVSGGGEHPEFGHGAPLNALTLLLQALKSPPLGFNEILNKKLAELTGEELK